MSSNSFGLSGWVPTLEPDDDPAEVLAAYAMSRLVARARAELGESASAATVAGHLYGEKGAVAHDDKLRTKCSRTMRGKPVQLAEFLRWCQAFGVEPGEVLGKGLADAGAYPPLHRQSLHVPRSGLPVFRSSTRLDWAAVLDECLVAFEDDAERVGVDFITSASAVGVVARALVGNGVKAAQLRRGEGHSFEVLTGTPRNVELRAACGDKESEWTSLLAALVSQHSGCLVVVAGPSARARLDSELPGLLDLRPGESFEVPLRAHDTITALGGGDGAGSLEPRHWTVSASVDGDALTLRVLEAK